MSFIDGHWKFQHNFPDNIAHCNFLSRNYSVADSSNTVGILTEALPATQDTHSLTAGRRSSIGAELLIQAADSVLKDLENDQLNFEASFFPALMQKWKTKVFIHASNYPLKGVNISLNQIDKTNHLNNDLLTTLKVYDASIGILHIQDHHLRTYQAGKIQSFLLDQRYSCELLSATTDSLTDWLVENKEKPLAVIDDEINNLELEMIGLLPVQYTNSRTALRIKAYIFRLYRALSANYVEDKNTVITANPFIAFQNSKNSDETAVSAEMPLEQSKPVVTGKLHPPPEKKRFLAYTFSVVGVISSLMTAYYLWNVEAQGITDNSAPALTTIPSSIDKNAPVEVESNNIPPTPVPQSIAKVDKAENNLPLTASSDTGSPTPEIKLINSNEAVIQAIMPISVEADVKEPVVEAPLIQTALKDENKEKRLLEEAKKREEKVAREKAEVERLQKEKREQQRIEQERLDKERQTVLKQQQEAEQKRKEEALRRQQIEQEKEQQRLRQIQIAKEAAERNRIQQEREAARIKAEAEKRQKEESAFLEIQNDIDKITEHEKKIQAQQIRAQQQRRRQIEEQKRAQQQTDLALEAQKRQRANQPTTPPITQTTTTIVQNAKPQQVVSADKIPASRKDMQRQTLQHIRQQEIIKQRRVQQELKKQQLEKQKARVARQKEIQQTITHQLVNYSKTFNRHTLRLQDKLNQKALIDQRNSNDPALIRKRQLLITKEEDIRKRLRSLSNLYAVKLNQLCAKPTIFPISIAARNNQESQAISIIKGQVDDCAQNGSLSKNAVHDSMLNGYLK